MRRLITTLTLLTSLSMPLSAQNGILNIGDKMPVSSQRMTLGKYTQMDSELNGYFVVYGYNEDRVWVAERVHKVCDGEIGNIPFARYDIQNNVWYFDSKKPESRIDKVRRDIPLDNLNEVYREAPFCGEAI